MGADVGAEVQWVLVDRRGEGVVDDELGTVSLHNLGEFLNVKDLQGRVGWGLKPDKLGVGAELLLELGDVAEVLERDVDVSVGSENAAEVSLCTAVDVINAEDVVTLLAEVHKSDMSSHARAGCEGVGAIFHRGKLSLKGKSSGVTAASVVENDGDARGGLSIGRREV